MSAEQGLLSDIRERPEDDVPRLDAVGNLILEDNPISKHVAQAVQRWQQDKRRGTTS